MRALLTCTLLPFALSACTGGGGGGGGVGGTGLELPSVGAEVVLRDTTIEVGELQLRLLVTPDQLSQVLSALQKRQAAGGGGSGGPSKG